jgi:hypothetical protein
LAQEVPDVVQLMNLKLIFECMCDGCTLIAFNVESPRQQNKASAVV